MASGACCIGHLDGRVDWLDCTTAVSGSDKNTKMIEKSVILWYAESMCGERTERLSLTTAKEVNDDE